MKRLAVILMITIMVAGIGIVAYDDIKDKEELQEIRGLLEEQNVVQVESPYPAVLESGEVEGEYITGNLVVTLPQEAVKSPPPQITRLDSGSYRCSFYITFWTNKQLQTWSWYECTSFQGWRIVPREILVRFPK